MCHSYRSCVFLHRTPVQARGWNALKLRARKNLNIVSSGFANTSAHILHGLPHALPMALFTSGDEATGWTTTRGILTAMVKITASTRLAAIKMKLGPVLPVTPLR